MIWKKIVSSRVQVRIKEKKVSWINILIITTHSPINAAAKNCDESSDRGRKADDYELHRRIFPCRVKPATRRCKVHWSCWSCWTWCCFFWSDEEYTASRNNGVYATAEGIRQHRLNLSKVVHSGVICRNKRTHRHHAPQQAQLIARTLGLTFTQTHRGKKAIVIEENNPANVLLRLGTIGHNCGWLWTARHSLSSRLIYRSDRVISVQTAAGTN